MASLEKKLQEMSDKLSKGTIDVVGLEEKRHARADQGFEDGVADLTLEKTPDAPGDGQEGRGERGGAVRALQGARLRRTNSPGERAESDASVPTRAPRFLGCGPAAYAVCGGVVARDGVQPWPAREPATGVETGEVVTAASRTRLAVMEPFDVLLLRFLPSSIPPAPSESLAALDFAADIGLLLQPSSRLAPW